MDRALHGRAPGLTCADPNHGFAWIRMLCALTVVYLHCYPLVSGNDIAPSEWPMQPADALLMAFFAMSGFQITESWVRDPHPARFAIKRVLRLWPPMLAVSLSAALIIGPLVSTYSPGEYFAMRETWGYVVNNAGMLTLQHELPGVFTTNPWENSVNGSLWTLPMELVAYVGLLALMLVGGARSGRRPVVVAALVVLAVVDRRLEQIPGENTGGSLVTVPIEPMIAFLVAFGIGMVLNLYSIPKSPIAAFAGLAALLGMPISTAGSFWLTISVSYAAVTLGHFFPARLTVPGVFVNGSYGVYVWGCPIQQVLAFAGIRSEWTMALLALPLAYTAGMLSWKVVEEPMIRLRHHVLPARKGDTPHVEPKVEPKVLRSGRVASSEPDRVGSATSADPATEPVLGAEEAARITARR